MVDIFQNNYLNNDYKITRTSSKRMHLTLLILRIEEGDELERAKALFKNCKLDMNLSHDDSLLQLGRISQFGI